MIDSKQPNSVAKKKAINPVAEICVHEQILWKTQSHVQ